MTIVEQRHRGALLRRLPRPVRTPVAPLDPLAQVVSAVLLMVAIVMAGVVVNLLAVSHLQHLNAQKRLYAQFREQLAAGSVPIGQTGVDGKLVGPGSPIALLRIPSLGVQEVVVEGTASAQTMTGVGHRRDTSMPGQAGVVQLFGRAAAYGGPFAHLDRLKPGAKITVLTGQGTATYEVIGQRVDGQRIARLGAQDGRLTLVSAVGFPYLPTHSIRVDAKLISPAAPVPPRVLATGALDSSELALRGDWSHAFPLSWLAELLVVVGIAATWSWKRWRKPATWIVFVPVIGATALAVTNLFCMFLPNLL